MAASVVAGSATYALFLFVFTCFAAVKGCFSSPTYENLCSRTPFIPRSVVECVLGATLRQGSGSPLHARKRYHTVIFSCGLALVTSPLNCSIT